MLNFVAPMSNISAHDELSWAQRAHPSSSATYSTQSSSRGLELALRYTYNFSWQKFYGPDISNMTSWSLHHNWGFPFTSVLSGLLCKNLNHVTESQASAVLHNLSISHLNVSQPGLHKRCLCYHILLPVQDVAHSPEPSLYKPLHANTGVAHSYSPAPRAIVVLTPVRWHWGSTLL